MWGLKEKDRLPLKTQSGTSLIVIIEVIVRDSSIKDRMTDRGFKDSLHGNYMNKRNIFHVQILA